MAKVTSGTLNTNSYSGRYYQLSWTSTQNIDKNQTTINWALKALGASGSWFSERTLKVTINGDNVVNKSDRVQRYDGTIASGTKTISHNANGSKSFSASIEAAVYYASVNCTGSASWDLKDIPRSATITSAPNFNDEENPTITYSNPAGTAVTKLEACISLTTTSTDIAYRNIPLNGTSYTFVLTEAERNVLRNATANGNSRDIYFWVSTNIGGGRYHSSLKKTFTVINAEPTLSATVEDINPTTLAVTGDNNTFVKYCSDASYKMKCSAYKGASIVETKVACGDKTNTLPSGTIQSVESGRFTFSVKDSRGNAYTQVVNKSFIDYVKLTCNLDIKAPDAEGRTNFTVLGKCCKEFGEVSVQYRYKINDGEYGEWIPISNDISFYNDNTYNVSVGIEGLDYQSIYTFQARAIDGILTVDSGEYKVKTAPIFDWSNKDFNFNVPVSFNETAMVDFVVESGTSGIWTYRKWNSGLAECWGSHNVSSLSCNISWGALYETESITIESYPFKFKDIPNLSACWKCGNQAAMIEGFFNSSVTSPGDTYLTRPNIANNISGIIYITAIGMWK